MMHHHTFDTYAIVKRFTGAGIKEIQAHEIVNAIVESRNYDLSNLATKSDIAELEKQIGSARFELKEDITSLRTELKEDIASLRTEVKEDIAEIRQDMEKNKNETLKWVFGIQLSMTIAIASTIIACFKLFM